MTATILALDTHPAQNAQTLQQLLLLIVDYGAACCNVCSDCINLCMYMLLAGSIKNNATPVVKVACVSLMGLQPLLLQEAAQLLQALERISYLGVESTCGWIVLWLVITRIITGTGRVSDMPLHKDLKSSECFVFCC